MATAGYDETQRTQTLQPFPPAGGTRTTPRHVVRLRSPEPIALSELLSRVESAEAHLRGEISLVEDNAWMVLALFHWNQLLSIDPNVEWAEEASRDIVLRHEDRDRMMIFREQVAHRRLALERFRSRVAAIHVALMQQVAVVRPAVESEERLEREEVVRQEKVNRPWMSSLLSPRRRGAKSPAFAGQVSDPTSPIHPPEPPKITQPAFSRFLGRELWAREKQLKYDRLMHTRRFEKSEAEEEAERGSVEADEALDFMRLQQQFLEERFDAQKQFIARQEEEKLGQLSQATLQRRTVDAVKRIQRFGRHVNDRLHRSRIAIDGIIQARNRREQSATRIQSAERSRQARAAVARRVMQVAESTERRVQEEQQDVAAEGKEGQGSGLPPVEGRRTSQPFGIEEAFASSKPIITTSSPNESPRPVRRKSEAAPNHLSLDGRPSRAPSMRSTPPGQGLPWEAAGARTDLVALRILAKAVFTTSTPQQLSEQTALRPLWRAAGFALTTTKEAPSVVPKASSFTAKGTAGGYAMLELLCSTLDTAPEKHNASGAPNYEGLLMVVEGLYGASDRPQHPPLPCDGQYPHMEHLYKIVSGATNTNSHTENEVGSTVNRSDEDDSAVPLAAAPAPRWIPQRLVTRAWLAEFWNTASHHHSIKNAIELTPPRWDEYDRADLETEERLQLENTEMLRREKWIEEQVDEAFGVVCVFYMNAGAPLRPPSARTA